MRARAAWPLLLVALAASVSSAQDAAFGAADCEMCHDEVVAAYREDAHGRAMLVRDAEIFERSCVACHGNADAHVDDPATDNIVGSPDSETCSGCHIASRAMLEVAGAAHNRQGVACLDCHQAGHAATQHEALLLDKPWDLCSSCHLQQAGAFRLPFAHRDGTEPFACTTCHAVHGRGRVGRLSLLADGGACIDCHTGIARPRVFQHPPAGRPGCESCHMPHGSTNPKQLTRRDIHLLCLECHTGVPAFHDITNARYRNCQTCHLAVHGSNRDPLLFEE